MLCDYLPSIFETNSSLLSCFKKRHSVHPEQPVAPKHNEFFNVTSQRRIRIIHIKPEISNVQLRRDHHILNKRRTDKTQTLSGEYWFTCWNRPIQTDKCNCSFRKSTGNNKSDKVIVPVNIDKSYNEKNSKIESYVEKIITNALLIAYQEYIKKYLKNDLQKESNNHNKTNGNVDKSCSKVTVSLYFF